MQPIVLWIVYFFAPGTTVFDLIALNATPEFPICMDSNAVHSPVNLAVGRSSNFWIGSFDFYQIKPAIVVVDGLNVHVGATYYF